MERRREILITEIAEDVAEKYSRGLKIDLFEVADEEGITVCDGRYGNHFEAMIEFCAEEKEYPFHIYLNKDILRDIHSLRTRLTFGYELGHYFIPEHNKRLLRGESLTYDYKFNYVENPVIEQEAQCFSANLLMPPSKFKAQAKRFREGLNAVFKLSNRFDTSMLSTALQYVKMDLMPCLLVKWSRDNEFEWKYVSPSFKRIVRGSYQFQYNSIRPISDCDEIELKIGNRIKTYDAALVNLSSWVHDIAPGSRRDLLLVEHSMTLGQYGGISLLYLASF